MKILTWVHRMLNHKDELAQNARKSGVTGGNSGDEDIDKQFMLENNALSGVFDGWKGGILAIGTFGYDPLKDKNEEENDEFLYKQESEKEQLSVLENDSDHQITDSEEEEDEEEEVNPLMYAAYAHDYGELLEMKMEEKRVTLKDKYEFDEMMNPKKVRTTLAELFSADSEEMQNKKKKKKKQPINKGQIIKEKSNYKHGLSLAKKLINIGDDARPVHKLHRLVRRMLQRKIHPDLGLNYKHNQINSKVVVQKCETSCESASLLPTQDAII
ncbi:hypothetical protein CDL12_21459 [Handroanthus impetiginosus]|uniref:Protein TILLER ANGLE CONTROL 1 n=1 Tax=Handroanthus impetiginosus TaxID=429701 RepID=A0A2G9GL38_9LAMI|nr:hypothetical protein CDL12_21459 [Handroanthus impetiginosus]